MPAAYSSPTAFLINEIFSMCWFVANVNTHFINWRNQFNFQLTQNIFIIGNMKSQINTATFGGAQLRTGQAVKTTC